MSSDFRISVIIPSYNSAPYLPETLASVFAQTYPVHEIIVVDDGSSDNTEEVLRAYRERITYVKQANAGVSCARNNGIERATGNWMAFLDSDDVWAVQKLERQVAFLRGGDYVCVHTNFYVFGEYEDTPLAPPEVLRQQYDLATLLIRFFISPGTALIRRDTRARFSPWARMSEDTIYFLDLLAEGRFGFINEPLMGYRRWAGSLTHQADAAVRSYENRRRWLWEQEKLPRETRENLERELFLHLGEAVLLARWVRDWQRYWRLRNYLGEVWKWPDPPAVLHERVYPPWVYRLKDGLDRVLGRSDGKQELNRKQIR